jgi:BASS family bile acid:Na+ symporter
MPVGVPLLLPGTAADPLAIARPLLVFVLLPLLAGTTIRGLRPRPADRIEAVVATVTRAATLVMLVALPIVHGQGVIQAIGSHAIFTQTICVTVVTMAAQLSGSGLPDSQRAVLTIGMATRNLGAALAPAAAIDPDPKVIVMIAIAVPVTFAVARMAVHRRPAAGIA